MLSVSQDCSNVQCVLRAFITRFFTQVNAPDVETRQCSLDMRAGEIRPLTCCVAQCFQCGFLKVNCQLKVYKESFQAWNLELISSAGSQASPSVPRLSKSQAQSFVRLNPRPLSYKEGNREQERMFSPGLGFPVYFASFCVREPEESSWGNEWPVLVSQAPVVRHVSTDGVFAGLRYHLALCLHSGSREVNALAAFFFMFRFLYIQPAHRKVPLTLRVDLSSSVNLIQRLARRCAQRCVFKMIIDFSNG